MLKRSFILIGAVGVSVLFASQPETVRESTVIYKLKEGATAAELKSFNALVNRNTIIEEKEIKGLQVKVVKVKNIKGLEKAFSKQLMNTGAVKFAEPDALIPHAAIPSDTSYSSQWHHPKINSPVAWDTITGSEVKVCVLDTGVDTDHPDLVGNLLLPGYNAQLRVDGNVEDAHGHGTGTSGVIGAVGNNNIGVAGMAWDINIIPVQINISNTNSSAYISTMAVGIEWCADHGGKVANLSYGGAQYATIDAAAQYLRDRGGLLFMSAGNDGTYNSTSTYPDYTSFVIVGATDQSDVKASWSEYGPFVDITAPGVSIRTTYNNGGYVYYSGTSFSSPMTAGLGALIYSVNPNFTPAEVEDILFSTAVDLGSAGDDDVYGHGRIDAGAAVIAATGGSPIPNEPPVANAAVTPQSGIAPLDVSFDGTASTDDGTIVTYLWHFGDGSTGSGITATHTYASTGTYSVTLTVTDDEGAQNTSAPITIEVTSVPNNPPVAVATADTTNGPAPLTVTFDGSSSTDDEGPIDSYDWDFGDGNTGSGITITHTYESAEEFTAKLIVTDDAGASDEATVSITATNIAPEASFSATPTSGDIPLIVELDASASSDSDGTIEQYDWNFGDGTTAQGITASHIYNTAGNFTITLTVTDNVGETGSASTVISAIDPGSLNAPAGLTATVSGSTVSLSWTDNSDEDAFVVQRAQKIKGKYDFADIGTTGANVFAFVDSDLRRGTYQYRVYGKRGTDTTSDYSNVVTVRTK